MNCARSKKFKKRGITMEFYDGIKVRQSWKENGEKPCKHAFEVEYLNGSRTEDYVCRYCGKAVHRSEIENK
ncbi:hypothetical protein NRS6183_11525 [Bacillus subtilis]|nr:hypothetical protein NRS6183_03085 [Bacillus subtilis]CAI6275106.1 hypothetical protein NRS6183_11525 [Bacillus subtilis]